MTDDVLKQAIEIGIIDISDVREKIDMYNKNQILEQHKYKISQGSDGFWRTYLPDEIKGRRMIKKKTQGAIEKAVIEYYKNQAQKESQKTFDDLYHLWRGVQDTLVSDNTTVKYDTDYIRYFKDTVFSARRIDDITESDIKVFICETVKKQHLCKKACKTLFGYVKNTFCYAYEKRVISENPAIFLIPKQFYKYCTEANKTVEQKTVSDEQMKLLYGQICDDYKNQPWYIPTYAVHLAILTGMRVGELSALRWDSIKDDHILIDKSEKYNRKTKTYYVDKTKTRKDRTFPITPEIQELLDRIKKVEIEYGYICEWIFANEEGRIHAPVISSCSKNKCRQVGIDDKGIHAYRKTFNSTLRCNGVPAVITASLLGNTEEVNNESYTFDIIPMVEKAKMVSRANKRIS